MNSGKTPPGPPLDEHGLPPGYRFRPEWEVTPRQLKALLAQDQDLVLIDCRTPGEHQLVNLPQAQLVPLQQLMQRLDELRQLADKKVVVYCHHGMRSMQMVMMLKQHGVKDIKSMAGGIDLWAHDVEPGMKRY